MAKFKFLTIGAPSSENVTLEKLTNEDTFAMEKVLNFVEEYSAKNSFLNFLKEKDYLDIEIKENAIIFSTNPLAFVLASKKWPEQQWNIKEGY